MYCIILKKTLNLLYGNNGGMHPKCTFLMLIDAVDMRNPMKKRWQFLIKRSSNCTAESIIKGLLLLMDFCQI